MLCTEEELIAITHKERPSAQARALLAMGIAFKPRPDGTLAVSRAHVEHLLGGAQRTTMKKHEPDWSALNAKASKP